MPVNYDQYALTFSQSRKDLKWREIEYFVGLLKTKDFPTILDIGCGNGRLLGVIKESGIELFNYLGTDSSSVLLEEARKLYPSYKFEHLDMINSDKLTEKFSDIFFVASFHHLDTIEKRKEVLKQIHSLLKEDGTVYMTNWALESSVNYMKYRNSKIANSENEFGSSDFEIKIGEHKRFYHSFSLAELEYLFKETGFYIVKNEEFENMKNIISIIKKLED